MRSDRSHIAAPSHGRQGKLATKAASVFLSILFVWQVCLGMLPLGSAYAEEGSGDAVAADVGDPAASGTDPENLGGDEGGGTPASPDESISGDADADADMEEVASADAEPAVEPIGEAPDELSEEERAELIAQAEAADAAAGAGTVFAEDEVLVVFDGSVSNAEATEIVEEAPEVEVPAEGIDAAEPVVTVDVAETASVADAVEALEADPNVVLAQPNYLYYLMEDDVEFDASAVVDAVDDPSASSQWYLDGANLPAAWDMVTCDGADSRVGIAILDSGCNLGHEDLAANIVGYYDATAAVRSEATGMDDISNHGTHVCGIASAVTNNGVGIAGASYNAGLVPIQVFYYNTSGNAVTSTSCLVAGYNWMIENQATYNIRVANMSVGGVGHLDKNGDPTSTDYLFADAIDRADAAGILTVCAAGNASSTASVPYNAYPGDYDTCLSVMNLTSSDVLSSGSNYNTADVTETSENYTKDICAPGTSIYSTVSSGGYGSKNGTSMAAPLVAGIAALVFTVDPALSPADVRSILESTAVDLGSEGWDQTFGYGKVDAAAAVEAAGAFEPPDMEVHATVAITAVDGASGTYTVTVSDINCPAGVVKVQLPTWAKDNQSDIRWYAANDNGDGTYSFTVSMANHGWTEGTYHTHAYITDGDGTLTRVGIVDQQMAIPPAATALVSLNSSQTTATVTVIAPHATAVRVPIWSENKGQDDLVWYTATKQAGSVWTVTVPLNKHKSTGRFQVHCYVTAGGVQSLATHTTFTVDAPTAAVAVTSVDESAGTYTVTVSDIVCPSGVVKIQLPTWVRSDQKDIKWYVPKKNADGSYSFTVPMSDHSWTAGSYKTHCYITDGNGAMSCVGGISQSMAVPNATITATLNSAETRSVRRATIPTGATAVRFAVWSDANGQDDIIWHTATKQSDGSWKATVDLSKHKGTGNYKVHCYATVAGSQTFVGSTTFDLATPQATVAVTSVDERAGTYTITISDIVCPAGVAKMQVPTWVQPNQSDIKWYVAEKNADGTYSYTVPLADHAWAAGTYHSHVYITDGNGNMTRVGFIYQDMTTPAKSVTAELSDDEKKAHLIAVAPDATSVNIAVWSVATDKSGNAQDDLIWYRATKQADGTWTADVPISQHGDAGRYQVHCYGTVGGTQTFVANTTFEVSVPKATMTVVPNDDSTAMTISVQGIDSPSGVSSIQVPTWSAYKGQDDIVWHTLSGSATRGYGATVDVGKHYYSDGVYNMHCYLTAGNGVRVLVAATTVNLTPQLRGVLQVISDTQLLSYNCMEGRHFADVLSDIQGSGGTDGIVINGDMTENSQQAEYNYMKSIIGDAGFTMDDFSFNMGNHEMRSDFAGESYGILWTRFRNNFDLPANYYTKEIAGQHFIFCGCDEAPRSTWVASRFSTAQINWLEQQISANEEQGYTSYVCIHHPIINTVNGSLSGQWGVSWGNGLENGAVVRNALDRHANVIVFTSHTHYDLNASSTYRASAFQPLYVNTAAVAYTNNDDADGGEAAQGWYLFLFDDRVELRGRDFLHNAWVDTASYSFHF